MLTHTIQSHHTDAHNTRGLAEVNANIHSTHNTRDRSSLPRTAAATTTTYDMEADGGAGAGAGGAGGAAASGGSGSMNEVSARLSDAACQQFLTQSGISEVHNLDQLLAAEKSAKYLMEKFLVQFMQSLGVTNRNYTIKMRAHTSMDSTGGGGAGAVGGGVGGGGVDGGDKHWGSRFKALFGGKQKSGGDADSKV